MLAGLSVLGLGFSLLSLGLWGVLINGGGISAIFSIDTWYQAASTSLGSRTGLLAGGLTGIWLSILLGQDFPTGRYLGLFGAVLMILSFAASGHAASSGILFKPVFIIHALVAAVWFGAMFILYSITTSEDAQRLKALLLTFSNRARYLVGGLLVCALILVFHQVNSISSLVNSQYGLLLLLKIFLVIVVLTIALMNRWYFTPELDDLKPVTTARLRHSIGIESFILFLIIAVTAVLSSTSPDEVYGENDNWSVTLTNSSDLITHLTMSPLRTGRNEVELEFFMLEELFEPQEVEVQWLHAEAEIEPVSEMARRTGAGIYRVNNMNILIPGEWTIRINVLVDDFTRERITTRVQIE
jgi:copper transport protein